MAKKTIRWVVVHPSDGARLCKDFRWRSFACFGTMGSCVKLYKNKKSAQKAGVQYTLGYSTVGVAPLYLGEKLDASGNILNNQPSEENPSMMKTTVTQLFDRSEWTEKSEHLQ